MIMKLKRFRLYLTESKKPIRRNFLKKIQKILHVKVLAFPTKEVFVSNGIKKEGFRYFVGDTLKSFRLNFSSQYSKTEIESIDVWDGSTHEPNINIDLRNRDTNQMIKQVGELIRMPRPGVYDVEVPALYEKARSIKKDIVLLIAKKGRKEVQLPDADTKDSEKILDSASTADVIELFKDLRELTRAVARGKIPALLVTGDPGTGKSTTVRETAKRIRGKNNCYFTKGVTSPLGLYRILYQNRKKLIVFDDSDTVFADNNSKDILKAALDSAGPREVSWLSPVTINPETISDEELEKGRLPSRFSFKRGSVIFVSNIDESKIDRALLSRSVHINIKLTEENIVSKIRIEIKRILPRVDIESKLEVLAFMKEHKKNWPKAFNIRTFVKIVKIKGTGSKRWKDLSIRYA